MNKDAKALVKGLTTGVLFGFGGYILGGLAAPFVPVINSTLGAALGGAAGFVSGISDML